MLAFVLGVFSTSFSSCVETIMPRIISISSEVTDLIICMQSNPKYTRTPVMRSYIDLTKCYWKLLLLIEKYD